MHALPRLRSAQIPTPMASPVVPCIRQSHQSPQSHQHQPAAGRAVREARTWIEAVTGRSFGEKETRAGLENGVLLCELLTSIKPGLVKRINRLETPIARQDNLTAFLRGCQDLGLSGSQLFDPGDLQDPSPSQDTRGNDSCKLQNVLITLYHLGRAANACPSYSGPTLDLGQFEDLLSQMQKEAEEADSAARSTRDSGYIDSWESERSDSLSPPAHARDDSLDSLDSLSTHSAHTPSPDALGPDALGSDALGLHACSDGPSDSESDGPFHRKMPDVRKDDMLARRTSVSEPKAAMPFNQYLPNKSNQSGYLPLPLRKKRDTSESRRTSESHRTSWSTATSPVGGDRPLSSAARASSEELFTRSGHCPSKLSDPSDGLVSVKDQLSLGCSLSVPASLASSLPSSPASSSPASSSLAAEPGRGKNRALSESSDPPGAATWLDTDVPTTSVSLIDMRDGEDPHSQSRHELMHNQYNILKEDESHWQDDLARWKNRRRSVSQDLIKKEEERKQMEQLLTGETVVPHRRRSIKTYREIVEDKERREEELRVAYKSARSQEEASSILQRYAQRFSISEAILERLQLPKLLDVSSDPGCPFPLSLSLSPTEAPDHTGPLRYLRQQSAPSPRFTSTLEARVEEYPTERATHVPQIRSRSSEPPSSRALCPKAVPLLTPRPYSSSTDSWSGGNGGGGGKMDGLLRVNGASDGLPCTPDSSLDSPVFQSWTPTSPFSPGSSPLTPITPLTPESHSPVLTNHQGEPNHKTREESEQPSHPSSLPTELQKREESWSVTSLSDAKPDPSSAERSRPESQEWRTESAPVWIGRSSSDAASDLTNSVSASLSSSTPKLRWEFFAHSDETRKDLCENVSGSGPSRWSWDQKEERQRQRRWQEEQEQMLQEKYRVEQEKLRQEWERAQREVVEEERKYHQEEQRILEETTAPLTPVSPVSPVVPVQQDALSELHTQKENSEESRRRDYDRTSDISTADESMKTARSSLSHSSLQNGQSPSDQSKVSSPLQQTNNRQRRSGPLDNSSSSSKPPNASDCVPPSPNRSVSGKKLCSSCTQPLGKGAAMIIETLGLYFHIHCFKCGMCKGLLGDTTTGTDVRIRNGLLNCHQCYIRSRSSGQPTML